MTRAQRSKRCVSDLCEITSSKRIFASDYRAEGVPFFRGKEITEKYNGAIEVSTELFIERSKFEEIKAKSGAPMPGDLLLTSVGTLGSTYVVSRGDEFYFKDGNITWFRNFRGLDSTYFNYWLTAPDGRAELKKCTIGSSQSAYTIVLLKGMEIDLPSLPEQRRIASILSAYDDLIENNTRRIAILEEMARRIYEEWFVRFRFPGHEGVRMVETELGRMPEGWNRVPLGTLVGHHIGGGWGQDAATEEFSVSAYVIRGTDIPDVRLGSLGRSPLRFHTPSNFRNRRLQPRDIVFEVSGGSKDQPVGRAVMVGDALLSRADAPVICASFCRLVRADPKLILPELLRFHFDHIYATREIMQYQTQSTGITNFKFTVFLEKEMVLKPPADLQDQFSKVVLPMLRLAESLGIKNSVLRATRCLLLPKLVSGELDVSDLPEPEAVAA